MKVIPFVLAISGGALLVVCASGLAYQEGSVLFNSLGSAIGVAMLGIGDHLLRRSFELPPQRPMATRITDPSIPPKVLIKNPRRMTRS